MEVATALQVTGTLSSCRPPCSRASTSMARAQRLHLRLDRARSPRIRRPRRHHDLFAPGIADDATSARLNRPCSLSTCMHSRASAPPSESGYQIPGQFSAVYGALNYMACCVRVELLFLHLLFL